MNVTPPKTQSKPIMSVDEAVNKDDPRPGGHDKKFQSWTLSRPTDKGYANETKVVEVLAHPANGQRAARIVGFVTEYDGVGFYDTDIVRLSDRLEAYHLGIKKEEFEKVLIIQTTGGRSWAQRNGNELGIVWRIGWAIKRLGFVYDEDRRHKYTDVYYSEYDQIDPFARRKEADGSYGNETELSGDDLHYLLGEDDQRKKSMEKMAIIDWTEEREAALQAAADKLEQIRNGLDDALKEKDFFAALLDSQGAKLLESTLKDK